MNKIKILKLCLIVNISFLLLFIISFFVLNNQDSSYFRVGWSESFVFVSVTIDTPLKYFLLCGFISLLNITEVFLNDIAYPLINFSTYNPYKTKITEFSRFELEFYSNAIYLTGALKKMLQIFIALSQIDIAFISILSSQISVSLAINYLLNNKEFIDNDYIDLSYNSINDHTRLVTTKVDI